MNNQTQSFIVYRNSAEKEFYESGMIINIGVSALFFIVTIWFLMRLQDVLNKKKILSWEHGGIYGNVAMVLSAIMAIVGWKYAFQILYFIFG